MRGIERFFVCSSLPRGINAVRPSAVIASPLGHHGDHLARLPNWPNFVTRTRKADLPVGADVFSRTSSSFWFEEAMKSMALSPDQDGNLGWGPRHVHVLIRPVEVARTLMRYGPCRPCLLTAAISRPSGVSAMLFGRT